jgi:BASS family bile acid:Na+ symporter
VLALATAKRHPGIAMAIAATNFPEKTVLPAIALYTGMSAILITPYVLWRKRIRKSLS